MSSAQARHSILRLPKFSAVLLMITLCALRRIGVSAWTTTTKRSASNNGRRMLTTAHPPRVISVLSSTASARISESLYATTMATTRFSTKAKATTTTRLFSTRNTNEENDDSSLFVNDVTFTFPSMGIRSAVLLERLNALGLVRPTKVQAATFVKLSLPRTSMDDTDTKIEDGNEDDNSIIDDGEEGDLALPSTNLDETNTNIDDGGEGEKITKVEKKQANNVVIGSETGSGKTLAYLLPLLDDILQQKKEQHEGKRRSLSYDYARAIILVPNKELVQQVLRMAVPLCGGPKSIVWKGGVTSVDAKKSDSETCPAHQVVRLAVFPGGFSEPLDFKPFRDSVALGGKLPPVDLIVTTPAALGPLALKPKNIDMFADIETLVVDEADMLLDGGYIRQLENVLIGFRRADRLDPSMGIEPTQHVFCAATLPDMGLKSVEAYLQRKFPRAERIQMSGMHNARHYGLKEATRWIGPVETRKERMEKLIEMLGTPIEEGGLCGEKVMVFVNSVEDVEGAKSALDKAGISSVPYHAQIKLEERSRLLDRFRRYDSSPNSDAEKDSVPVLVCTDLASRGLDVPGVNAVVQLQFSGNVVSHLHRMGRCGRAGQRTGRGIVFYNKSEAELISVVQEAEAQQERMILHGDVDDQQGEDATDEESGNVKKAFSRRRGFNKKQKKIKREIGSVDSPLSDD